MVIGEGEWFENASLDIEEGVWFEIVLCGCGHREGGVVWVSVGVVIEWFLSPTYIRCTKCAENSI